MLPVKTSPTCLPVQGFRDGGWEVFAGASKSEGEVAALYETDDFGADDELHYGCPIYKRVYGVLERGADGWFYRVRTSFDLLSPDGGRSRFYVPLREDHVSIIWVGGVAVRQVWVGYVRSLVISDLLRAIPQTARLIDALREDVDRDLQVRSVRTVADWFCQEVEVVSVASLMEHAARFGIRADLPGGFWKWASMFVESLPHIDLMRIRRHDPDPGPDALDHAFMRPGDSAGAGLRHPMRAAIMSCHPHHEPAYGGCERPIPDVFFA